MSRVGVSFCLAPLAHPFQAASLAGDQHIRGALQGLEAGVPAKPQVERQPGLGLDLLDDLEGFAHRQPLLVDVGILGAAQKHGELIADLPPLLGPVLAIAKRPGVDPDVGEEVRLVDKSARDLADQDRAAVEAEPPQQMALLLRQGDGGQPRGGAKEAAAVFVDAFGQAGHARSHRRDGAAA